jgi:CheY-like chemotaxis protein
MNDPPFDVSPPGTSVLLVEVDPDARASHRATLESRGYVVTMAHTWPPLNEVNLAAVLITDVESFHTLPHSDLRRFRPVVVLTGDLRAGVSACLSGADAWVPTDGDGAYLIDTINGLTNTHTRSRAAAYAATGARAS